MIGRTTDWLQRALGLEEAIASQAEAPTVQPGRVCDLALNFVFWSDALVQRLIDRGLFLRIAQEDPDLIADGRERQRALMTEIKLHEGGSHGAR